MSIYRPREREKETQGLSGWLGEHRFFFPRANGNSQESDWARESVYRIQGIPRLHKQTSPYFEFLVLSPLGMPLPTGFLQHAIETEYSLSSSCPNIAWLFSVVGLLLLFQHEELRKCLCVLNSHCTLCRWQSNQVKTQTKPVSWQGLRLCTISLKLFRCHEREN